MADMPLSGLACRTNTNQSDCSNDAEAVSVTNTSISGAHLSTTSNFFNGTIGRSGAATTVSGGVPRGRTRGAAVRYQNLEAAAASPVLTKPNRNVKVDIKVNSSESIVGVFGWMQGWRKTMEDCHVISFPMLDPQPSAVPKFGFQRLGSGNSQQIPSQPFACTVSNASSPRFVNFALGPGHDEESMEPSATYPGRRASNQSNLEPISAIPAHSEVQSTASSPRGGVTYNGTNMSHNALNHHRNSSATAQSGAGYDPNSYAVIGVFDGHRGADAAAFASNGLVNRLGPVLQAISYSVNDESSALRKSSNREQIESLAIGKKSPLAIDDFLTERFIVEAFEDTDNSLREEHERQVQARASINQSPENPNPSQQSSPGGSPSFRHRGSEGLDTPPPIPLTTAASPAPIKLQTQSPLKPPQMVTVPITVEGSPSPLKFAPPTVEDHSTRDELDAGNANSGFGRPPMSATSSAAPTPRASTNLPMTQRSSPHSGTFAPLGGCTSSVPPPVGLQGSTAHVVVMTTDRYYFCNVGDSRGYLVTRRPLEEPMLSGAQSPNSGLMGSDDMHEAGTDRSNSPHGSFRTTSPPHNAPAASKRRTSQPHHQVTLLVDENTNTNSFASAEAEPPTASRPKRHSVITAPSSANTTNAQSPSLGPNNASPLTSNHDSPDRPSSVALALEDGHKSSLPYSLSVHAMSDDHRTSNDAERARVTAAGGTVINHRVNSKLSVTRAFGDIDLKPHAPSGLPVDFTGSLPSFGVVPTASYAPSLANSFAYSAGEVQLSRPRLTSGEGTPSTTSHTGITQPNPIIATPEVRAVARTASPHGLSSRSQHPTLNDSNRPSPLDATTNGGKEPGREPGSPQSPSSPDSPNSLPEDSARPTSYDIVLVGCDGVWELETAESIGKRVAMSVELVIERFYGTGRLMSETCESNTADVTAAMSGLAELVAAGAGQPLEITGSTLNATMLNTLNTFGSITGHQKYSNFTSMLVDAMREAVEDSLNKCCSVNCDPKGTTPGTDNLSLGVAIVFPPERLATFADL